MQYALRYRKQLLLLILIFFFQHTESQPSDQWICNKIFSFAFEHKLIEKPIGQVITSIGKEFLGTPYEAYTLDRSDSEHLVTNLHSFDCVTFVENVLSISRCVKENQLSYEAFRNELCRIRYRNGLIRGYSSRLHYFTDWIYDNGQKGMVQDKTDEFGGAPYTKTINFMTSHRGSYPRLGSNVTFNEMKLVEDSLSQHRLFYIPKAQLRNISPHINDGDIIAITTNKEGLDIIHVGIAVRMSDGTLHYMHAPNEKGVVNITHETLEEHLRKFPSETGIMIIEPADVQSR